MFIDDKSSTAKSKPIEPGKSPFLAAFFYLRKS